MQKWVMPFQNNFVAKPSLSRLKAKVNDHPDNKTKKAKKYTAPGADRLRHVNQANPKARLEAPSRQIRIMSN